MTKAYELEETTSAMSDESTRTDEDEAAEQSAYCSCDLVPDEEERAGGRCKACGKAL